MWQSQRPTCHTLPRPTFPSVAIRQANGNCPFPYAFRLRDMLVGSVAIFLAGSWVRRLAIAQRLDRSGCGSISPSA